MIRMDISLLIAGSVFVLILLMGSWAFYYSRTYKMRKGVQNRIIKETEVQIQGKSQQWKIYFRQQINKLGEAVKPRNEADISQIKAKLVRAGYYGEKAPFAFLGMKTFMAILFPATCMILKFTILKTLPTAQLLLLVICGVVAGFFLPDYYLYERTKTRKREIFDGFPDALDLMVVCVEAGMGLDAAIKRVGDEIKLKYRALSEEFRLLSLEMRAGKARAEALRNLATRTDIEDVSSLATLLIQTDRFGTPVAQALRVHSDSMRTKRYQRAEEMAAKLPVKIVFPLILFIFPSLFVTIVGPAVIKIYRNFIHQ